MFETLFTGPGVAERCRAAPLLDGRLGSLREIWQQRARMPRRARSVRSAGFRFRHFRGTVHAPAETPLQGTWRAVAARKVNPH